MKTVSVFKLRDNLSYYIDLVNKTNTSIIVEKYNTPAAVITPYKKGLRTDGLLSFAGFLGPGEDGKSFENKVRRNDRERKRIEKLRHRS